MEANVERQTQKMQSEQRKLVTDRMRGKNAARQITLLIEKTIDWS